MDVKGEDAQELPEDDAKADSQSDVKVVETPIGKVSYALIIFEIRLVLLAL